MCHSLKCCRVRAQRMRSCHPPHLVFFSTTAAKMKLVQSSSSRVYYLAVDNLWMFLKLRRPCRCRMSSVSLRIFWKGCKDVERRRRFRPFLCLRTHLICKQPALNGGLAPKASAAGRRREKSALLQMCWICRISQGHFMCEQKSTS